jgi:general secretion pathway protein D
MHKRALIAMSLALIAPAALGESQTAESARPNAEERGVPITRLISVVARKTGKRFVVDPRVQADVVIIGQDVATLTYGDLLSVLRIHGFAAFEDGGYVQVVPDANIRAMPVPMISDKETRPASEYVTALATVRNVPAPALIPILRPLMPQSAHLAALPCTNQILISDVYSNVRRIEGLIRSMDVGEPYKPSRCDTWDRPPSK